jgi:hypothetical protein
LIDVQLLEGEGHGAPRIMASDVEGAVPEESRE